MKKTLSLILLLVSIQSIAQDQFRKGNIGAGLTAGYSEGSCSCAVGEAFIAVRLNPHIIVYPFSFKAHSQLSNPKVPVIIEPRIGFKQGKIELYAGYGYHAAGQDGKQEYREFTGFKPALGAIIHVTERMILTTGLAGLDKNRIFTLQAGILRFR